MSNKRLRLVEVLRETRELLARPRNDFSWSSWDDSSAALAEIDGLIARLDSEEALPPKIEISVLFAPTGPVQEVSLSSGWGEEFLRVAERMDRAMVDVYWF